MTNLYEMDRQAVFPDCLHELTLKRLAIDSAKAETFRRQLDTSPYRGRITDIDVRCKGDTWTLRFSLDGRRSGKCFIEPEHRDWIDAGLLSVYELAVHHSGFTKPGFARRPVQRTLFD